MTCSALCCTPDNHQHDPPHLQPTVVDDFDHAAPVSPLGFFHQLNLPCTKRHIKIVRAMALGDANAAAPPAAPTAAGGSSITEPNANATKPKGGGKTANPANASLRAPPQAEGAASAEVAVDHGASTVTAGSTLVAPSTSATPIEGAVSLRTVGKTVAFLAKLAAPAAGGREGDGGVFGGSGKMTGGGRTGSAYG